MITQLIAEYILHDFKRLRERFTREAMEEFEEGCFPCFVEFHIKRKFKEYALMN